MKVRSSKSPDTVEGTETHTLARGIYRFLHATRAKEAGIYVIVYSSTILMGYIPGVENLPLWAQRKKKIEEHAHACLFILRGAVATKVANVVGENTYK